MRIRYTKTALGQIDRALGYVAERSPRAAVDIEARLQEIIAFILEYSEAGEATSLAGARRIVLRPYPYILFYRVVGDQVVVSQFRHAARRRPLKLDGRR